jgi:hypothetical protein
VFGRLSANERAALDTGKARLDGDAAATCFDAIATRSCDRPTRSARVLPEACDQIIRGTLGDREACAQDTECRSLHCDVPACGQACCAGTCAGDTAPAPTGLGESCAHIRCESSLYCDAATSTCVALLPEGAPCASPDACDFGLSCVFPAQGGLTCTALPGPGEPCTDACRDQSTTCSATTSTCVSIARAGDACTQNMDCPLFYQCDATRHCSLTPTVPVGAPCRATDVCAVRAFCDIPDNMIMGTCSPPKVDGSTCEIDMQCQSLICGESHTCTPEPVCL